MKKYLVLFMVGIIAGFSAGDFHSRCCRRDPLTNQCLCYALDSNCAKYCPVIGS